MELENYFHKLEQIMSSPASFLGSTLLAAFPLPALAAELRVFPADLHHHLPHLIQPGVAQHPGLLLVLVRPPVTRFLPLLVLHRDDQDVM